MNFNFDYLQRDATISYSLFEVFLKQFVEYAISRALLIIDEQLLREKCAFVFIYTGSFSFKSLQIHFLCF